MALIKGWQAASAASGIAVRTLRRLVQTGALRTIKNADGSHAFDINDLLKLKAGRHGSSPAAPTIATPMPLTTASATPVAAPTMPTIAPWLVQAAAAAAAASSGTKPANDDDDDDREDDEPGVNDPGHQLPFWGAASASPLPWPTETLVPVGVCPTTRRII